MKCLVPLPSETISELRRERETGPGYQVVAVRLKDGRHFDQVVASEGCVIAVRGYADVPFQVDEIANVRVNHQGWNFRHSSDARSCGRKAASA
jgi:hypothetical protein